MDRRSDAASGPLASRGAVSEVQGGLESGWPNPADRTPSLDLFPAKKTCGGGSLEWPLPFTPDLPQRFPDCTTSRAGIVGDMALNQLLEDVRDRDTFIEFVRALADEREQASLIERADPALHLLDGAHDWKNAGIDSFLYAALSYFDEKPLHKPEVEPSWRMFADFLYCGKIIE